MEPNIANDNTHTWLVRIEIETLDGRGTSVRIGVNQMQTVNIMKLNSNENFDINHKQKQNKKTKALLL